MRVELRIGKEVATEVAKRIENWKEDRYVTVLEPSHDGGINSFGPDPGPKWLGPAALVLINTGGNLLWVIPEEGIFGYSGRR